MKDFSKIAKPLTKILEKDELFIFSQGYLAAFNTFEEKLTNASIMVALD